MDVISNFACEEHVVGLHGRSVQIIFFLFLYYYVTRLQQLIVHKLQRTRYSFLVRMLFNNIQIQAELFHFSLVVLFILTL